MNTELRKEAKNDFEKDIFKLMNNAVFGKTTKCISENLLIIEMKKTEVKVNKPIYLGMSILLDISKTLMFEFW